MTPQQQVNMALKVIKPNKRKQFIETWLKINMFRSEHIEHYKEHL